MVAKNYPLADGAVEGAAKDLDVNKDSIFFSRGTDKFDNLPAQCEVNNFDAFAQAVLSDRATEKGKTYVCCAFTEGNHSNPEKYPGVSQWRQKSLALPRAFLPLDIDGVDSPETFHELLGVLNCCYRGFGYNTASHTPEAPRCRVVLALSRPTTREEGIALGEAVQASLEQAIGEGKVKFDSTVYKAEQPLYTPLVGAEVFQFEGLPVDVDNVLASFVRQPQRQQKGKRLEHVKTQDGMLQAMADLGMVKSDAGHGKFNIECPFAEQHTMDGGEGETVYYLPHTGGYAQGHFKCLHSHCERRSGQDFAVAVLAKYKDVFNRPAPFAVNVDIPPPTEKGDDKELAWIIDNAPPVLRAYITWYMENAIRPHPVFALVSGLLFAQLVIGRGYAIEGGLRANLWLLLLAKTASGKGGVTGLAKAALSQLKRPAIKAPESDFGSAEGLWWHMEKEKEVVWVDDELGKQLGAIVAARIGTPDHAKRRALMKLYDAAKEPLVEPIRYSRRTKSANEMQALCFPFLSVIGSGVPRSIETFTAAAADDGLLNRFLVVVLDDNTPVGDLRDPGALPEEVTAWAGRVCKPFAAARAMQNGAEEPMASILGLTVLPFTDDVRAAWKALQAEETATAGGLPGIWGRYAEKVLKAGMLHCVFAESNRLDMVSFKWGRRFVRWAVDGFAKRFAAEGGGAEGEHDAARSWFMAVFDAPSLADKDVIPVSVFAKFNRKWGAYPKRKRDEVIATLEEDGLIERVSMQPKGTGYRKL